MALNFGWLISLATFPGVIIHEWAHKKFCQLLRVPVFKVVYFRFGNPAGYVLHAEPRTFGQTFWISAGPLVINSLLAILLSAIASKSVFGSGFWFFLIWTAFSLGMHSFPSNEDVRNITESRSFWRYLAFPFVGLILLANKLRFFWFDAIYAAFLIFIGGGLNIRFLGVI
jgi:hypothetical protein